MKARFSLFFLLLFCFACDKTEVFDGANFYEDGFEAYASSEALLDENELFWTFTQLTLEGNTITVDSTFSRSGTAIPPL